jgi:hypothetical protein
MNMQQTCDPDRLDAFAHGELSEQQESELLTHRTRRSNVVDLGNDQAQTQVQQLPLRSLNRWIKSSACWLPPNRSRQIA